jgi:hypothetical protein
MFAASSQAGADFMNGLVPDIVVFDRQPFAKERLAGGWTKQPE